MGCDKSSCPSPGLPPLAAMPVSRGTGRGASNTPWMSRRGWGAMSCTKARTKVRANAPTKVRAEVHDRVTCNQSIDARRREFSHTIGDDGRQLHDAPI